jgi:hypothetical protein
MIISENGFFQNQFNNNNLNYNQNPGFAYMFSNLPNNSNRLNQNLNLNFTQQNIQNITNISNNNINNINLNSLNKEDFTFNPDYNAFNKYDPNLNGRKFNKNGRRSFKNFNYINSNNHNCAYFNSNSNSNNSNNEDNYFTGNKSKNLGYKIFPRNDRNNMNNPHHTHIMHTHSCNYLNYLNKNNDLGLSNSKSDTTTQFMQSNNFNFEDQELITLKIKLNNESKTLGIKRYDNYFIAVKNFCEKNNISDKLIKPIYFKLNSALNSINQVLNHRMDEKEQEYFNSIKHLHSDYISSKGDLSTDDEGNNNISSISDFCQSDEEEEDNSPIFNKSF